MAKDISTTIVLKVNGKDVENSFRGLSKEVRSLENELKELTPGTERFMRKAAELKEVKEHFSRVKSEIDAVSGKLKESEGFLGKLRSKLSDVGLGFGAIGAGLAGLHLKNTAEELLKVSDAMADVQKTTGMALDEVKQLWEAFDDMDTRTSKMDRLKIAEVGGRLGVPKEEMASFVQEVDKAYVALGDSFDGGLEGVVESFALRIGALPDALKPSIDKVLGLGAAFEESGVDSQIAASGYSNFMKVAGENIGLFAQSMHMSTAEAKELFNTNPEEFFLRFSEGMRGVEATKTVEIFDSLGIKSLEVQKAVGAAANRTDEFRAAMERSGKAMADGTSLSDEFSKKNNNAAAVVEKLKNAFADMFTSNNIINLFEDVIRVVGFITGVTKEAGDGIREFKDRLAFLAKIIGVMVTAMVSYKAAMYLIALSTQKAYQQTILYNAVQKAKMVIDNAAKGVTLLYAAAKATLSGNTAGATAAMRAFNMTTKMNPIGLLVAAVMAAVAAYKLYHKEVDASTQKQKNLNDAFVEAEKSIVSQKNELDQLMKTARDSNSSKEQQLEAIRKLNEISPEYLGFLNSENIHTKKATEAVNKYTEHLLKMARVKALTAKMDKIGEQIIDKENESLGENLGLIDKAANKISNFFGGKDVVNLDKNEAVQYQKWLKAVGKKRADELKKEYAHVYEKRKQDVQGLTDQQRALAEEIKKIQGEEGGTAPASNKPVNSAVAGPAKTKTPKYDKELLDAHRKYEDEREKIQLEGYEKEKRLLETEHNRNLEDIENQNKEKKDAIAKVEREISDFQKAKAGASPQAQKNYDAAIQNKREEIAVINSIIAQNNKIKEQMEHAHQLKIKTIDEKAELEKHQRDITNLQKEAALIHEKNENEITEIKTMAEAREKLAEMEFLKLSDQELKNIHTLEDAKKALRENANRAALQAQIELFKKEQKILEDLLSNPNVFSEKSVQELKERIASITTEVNKLNAAKNGNEVGDESQIQKDARKEMDKVDILGFSVTQWSDTFKNLDTTERKLQAVMMGVQALKNAFSQFSELQQRLNERELRSFTKGQDNKKKELLRQLNEGYINQEQYHKGVQLLEEETDAKKAELANRQAKIQKAMAIAQIAINTAQAIIGIWAQVPKFDFGISAGVLTGVVSALGAAQIAAVLAQPDSFDKGGFTGGGFGSPDSSGFRPAGIVHENEYVTPKWMLQNPVVADVVDWMESIRTGRTQAPRGYAEGGFTGRGQTSGADAQTPATAQMVLGTEMQPILSDLKQVLSELKENGVEAWMVENAENGKRLKNAIKQFENIEKRNARK